MKKIIIIDGGPRKNMNTAQLLQRFAEGLKSVGNDVEVKTVRLYDLDYKGCVSCMSCKLKGNVSNICRFKDALTPVLEEIAQAELNLRNAQYAFDEGVLNYTQLMAAQVAWRQAASELIDAQIAIAVAYDSYKQAVGLPLY